MRRLSTLLLTSAVAGLVAAQSCNITEHCSSDAPCCSEFGFCSTDHCMGGCNALMSFAPTSCDPEPICADKTYTFTDLTRIVNDTSYNGNYSAYDWTLDNTNGDPDANHIAISDGALALLLTENNNGTRISSTRYIHYGTFTATLKTANANGVVTAFIGMSNVKDEVDWEFPGAAGTTVGQSNYFWLGVFDPHGGDHNISSDASSNYHDYTFSWSELELSWAIDGNVVRTVKKSDTFNETTGITSYPTTPMRIQLSIWPAGIPSQPKGTQEWAGGAINWQDPDYQAAGGHFYALVKQVSVQCDVSGDLAPPASAITYVYGPNVSNLPAVQYSNESAMSSAPGAYLSGLRNLLPLVAAGAVAIVALIL